MAELVTRMVVMAAAIVFWFIVGYVAGVMALLWLSGFEPAWVGLLFAVVAAYKVRDW